MRAITILTLVSIGFLSGCAVPRSGSVLAIPETRGRVVDSATSLPVPGAQVIIDGRAESKTLTKEDGRFQIQAVRKKYVIECIEPGGVAGHFPPIGAVHWRLAVTHPAYQEKELYLSGYAPHETESTTNDFRIDVGDVTLNPNKTRGHGT